jgi:uncharacterized protein YggE
MTEDTMFKRVLLSIALIVPLALAGLWMSGQTAVPAAAQETAVATDTSRTITVVGGGMVAAVPDVARVDMGVETSAPTVSEAVAENAAKMDALLAALSEAGVASKDIQTSNFSINLDRYVEPMLSVSSEEAREPQQRYRVSNMVTVIVRDLDTISEVLDGVLDAGANNIWGVNFDLDDKSEAMSDARTAAAADALARAEALAGLHGVELGSVVSVSEVVGGNAVPVRFAMEAGMGGGGPISAGEVEISYQIQVAYAIAP